MTEALVINMAHSHANLLREAVADFEDSSQGEGACRQFCQEILVIADRIEPATRLVAVPLPAEGARRLLAALEAAPDYIERGTR